MMRHPVAGGTPELENLRSDVALSRSSLSRNILLAHGISPEPARFAAAHATWTAPGIPVEDLMVAVADKAWKNRHRRPGAMTALAPGMAR